MEKQKKKQILRQIYKALILLVICCLFGGLVELAFQAKFLFLDTSQKGVYELNLSKAELHGAELYGDYLLITGENMENYQLEESKIAQANLKSRVPAGLDLSEERQDYSAITFQFDRRYVNKLRLEFDTNSRFEATILLNTFSIYGEPIQERVPFSYTGQTGRGTLAIGKELDGLTILTHTPQVAGEEDKLRIVAAENIAGFNILRFGFFTALGVVLCMLIFYRKELTKRVEIGFVVISLVVGGVMIVTFPMDETSWDEQIHFGHVANMSYFVSSGQPVPVTVSENDMMEVRRATINSMEDRKDVIHYLNTNATPDHVETYVEKEEPYLKQVGYLTQVLFYKAARVVGFPFYYAYLAGKVGNLLLYTTVMYFALKSMKKGRLLMAVIALMPTSMLLASSYAYDPTVNCFMMLGIAIIFNVMLDPEQRLTIKSFVLFSVSMVIASMPKAVYIPFILIVLILPEAKFKSRKTMWVMKGVTILLFLAMMSTFVLPALFEGSEMGDSRGGDTNVAEQLKLIFSHPLYFTKILLLDSIIGQFGDFMMGPQSLLNFAYLGHRSALPYLAVGLMIFTVLTDQFSYPVGRPLTQKFSVREPDGSYAFSKFQKISVAVLCFGIIVLIWTALYLDFTPVGNTEINGVQGRYYLPILIPMFMLFQSDKIKNHFSRQLYTVLIYGAMAAILFLTVYKLLLLSYCM